MTAGVPGAPEPRMHPRSGYFLVRYKRFYVGKANITTINTTKVQNLINIWKKAGFFKILIRKVVILAVVMTKITLIHLNKLEILQPNVFKMTRVCT